MLKLPEREQVEGLFADALSEQMNARDLLTTIFRAESGPILLTLPSTATQVGEIASFVVTSCLDSGWMKNPALLDLLLTFLIDRRGQAQLTDMRVRVRAKIDPNPTLYDANWMSGKRPFFDRGDFRNRVAALVDQNARPILRITSLPDSFGRKYGTRFLEHLSDVLPGNMRVVSVELSPKTGPSYRPEDLASAVASQVVGFGPTAPSRTSSDYASTAALWILGLLIAQPGRWLIVLDGFGQKLQDETRLTIEALAAMVPTGQYRQRIRLVLVDYSDLPGVTLADTLDETLQPVAALAPMHIEACLQEMNATRQREGREPLPAALLPAIAAGMLAQAPPTGKERLAKLNEKLILLHDAPIEQILQGAGNGG
jgi:hypothetical protein